MFSVRKNVVWVYFIAFFGLWCLRELWLVTYVDLLEPTTRALVSAFIKIVIWVVPVFLIVAFIERQSALTYLGLRQNVRKGLAWAGWIALVLILFYGILNLVILDKTADFNLGLNRWLNTILLVGITEEIVFRGFLLKKWMQLLKFSAANMVTSLLFVSIHFPIWIYRGQFEFPAVLSSIVTLFPYGPS